MAEIKKTASKSDGMAKAVTAAPAATATEPQASAQPPTKVQPVLTPDVEEPVKKKGCFRRFLFAVGVGLAGFAGSMYWLF